MADTDETQPKKDADNIEERIENIARVVKDYLREGEAFLVQCQEDEILVEEAPHTRFQLKHPRLYGRLLSVNDQLDAGCGLVLTLGAISALLCLGLYAGWLDDLLPPNVVPHLQTWWFYVPFVVAWLCIGLWFNDRYAKRAYRRGRAELLAVMRDEGFERDTLVPVIKDIPEFESVVGQLKLDRGPFFTEG